MKRLGIALAGAAAAALAAAVAAGSAVRPGAPQLLRASASGNHVVAVARFAHGATPRLIEVARSPRLAGLGFVSGIVLRESISATPTPSGAGAARDPRPDPGGPLLGGGVVGRRRADELPAAQAAPRRRLPRRVVGPRPADRPVRRGGAPPRSTPAVIALAEREPQRGAGVERQRAVEVVDPRDHAGGARVHARQQPAVLRLLAAEVEAEARDVRAALGPRAAQAAVPRHVHRIELRARRRVDAVRPGVAVAERRIELAVGRLDSR